MDLRATAAQEFAEDPEYFFSYALQTDTLPVGKSPLVQGGLWEGEHQILRSLNDCLRDHQPLYIASGHALGKDFISGGLPLWWQTTRYPARTILTGPTHRQVMEITWNELVKHTARWRPDLPPLGGRLLTGKYEWDSEHFILAFTTAHSHQHIGKAQGFHSPHILVIVTEAQAVPNSVKEQIDGLLTSGAALLVVIGNPVVTTGWFADGLRDPRANRVLHLDCEDSPNVQEGREGIPGLVSKAWVEDKRRRWFAENPNHPLWLARVKGQLPTTSVDSVFDRALLTQSQSYQLADRGDRVVLGLDPAEFGDDESAFCVIADGITRVLLTTAKHEPTDTAGRAMTMRSREQARLIVVDRLGVGAGVSSMLQEMREEGWSVLPLNVAEKPMDVSSPYANQRAELYFHARTLLQEGKLRAPGDGQTVEELCETRFFFNSKGKILLERKEDIKDRLGHSPDRADAWVMAAWGLQFVTPLSEGGGDMPRGLRNILERNRMRQVEAVNF